MHDTAATTNGRNRSTLSFALSVNTVIEMGSALSRYILMKPGAQQQMTDLAFCR